MNKEAPPADPLESPIRDHSVANNERKWTTPSPKDRKGPKIRWSSEFLDEVARYEARLSLVGCRNMNVQLSTIFPDRTLEAIKGMRRLPKYRSRLALIQREDNLLPTLPVMDRPPPEQGCKRQDEESGGGLSCDNQVKDSSDVPPPPPDSAL